MKKTHFDVIVIGAGQAGLSIQYVAFQFVGKLYSLYND